MVSWKPCLIATAGYEYNCLVVHVTWYYTAYCIYVYTKAREDEFRELYRSYWRLAGLTDELWRTALVFTKSTSVKTGGQAPPLPNASYATANVVRDTFVSLRALRCATFLSPERYNPAVHNISAAIFIISPVVLIYHRLYLYISSCTYKAISICTYNYISSCTYKAVFIYISSCTYISPAVLIYLRLYLYISPAVLNLYITGCTYISPAVLNLYITGCTYIMKKALKCKPSAQFD